jgi:hypothetical protein
MGRGAVKRESPNTREKEMEPNEPNAEQAERRITQRKREERHLVTEAHRIARDFLIGVCPPSRVRAETITTALLAAQAMKDVCEEALTALQATYEQFYGTRPEVA